MTATTPHIFTLTGNLLAETTLVYDRWSEGATQRAQTESFQVGGKGINVAKMLNRLKVPNTALGFVGGATGDECERWLVARNISFHAFPTTARTRTGVVIRAAGQRETTFLGRDVAPDAAAIKACAEFLDAQPAGNVLALCGSFPGWDDARFDSLRDALVRWLSRGCLVADTYGSPLNWIARQPVELLKVNAAEWQTIQADAGSRRSVAALRYVITDGPRQLRLRDGIGPERMISPPAVQEISATGSGDVMLACLIEALFCRRKSLADAVAFALPYAAANAAHPGIAEFAELA